jgi:hypothetical protein
MKKIYLLNAFSLQMVSAPFYFVKVTPVMDLPTGLTSAIGHADTAAVLGVEVNRITVTLDLGDTAYVAQLIGGRLPEGATSLPENYCFQFRRVEIVDPGALVQFDSPAMREKYVNDSNSLPALWWD